MKIAVLKERAPGEMRVAASPETVKKFIALGNEFSVEAGAGGFAAITDDAFTEAGASIGDAAATVKGADIILGIQAPDVALLAGAKPSTWETSCAAAAILNTASNPPRAGSEMLRDSHARRCVEKARAGGPR